METTAVALKTAVAAEAVETVAVLTVKMVATSRTVETAEAT
jgi:hypothetical protein